MKPLPAACVIVIAAIVIAACSPTPAPTPTESPSSAADSSSQERLGAEREQAAASITEERIVEHVRVLSGDEFAGRGPASEGDRMTQAYLVAQLAAMGFQPGAADGGWLQKFDLVGIDPTVPERWSFTGGAERHDLRRWDDFVATSGVQSPRAVVEDAEVVFVGYGIQAPEYDWDDFKGQDLTGKILLMLNNDPEWDPDLFEGERRLYYGRWDYKYESAARQGAVGAIIIHTTPSAGYPWQVVQTSWTGEYFRLPASGEPVLNAEAWVTEDAARELVAMTGNDLDALVKAARRRDFAPVPLGIQTSLSLELAITRTQTANVLGLLPGSDPQLANEYVLLLAHHDHLGIGEPDATGDRIYNGARDNALGVATVLCVAEAYAGLSQLPRRSIMTLFVGAEEQGLLGSLYYARNPTVPPGRTAAAMNFDGGNIWGKARDIAFIGYGKSSLDAVVDSVAARQGRVVVPDQLPDRGFYYRSDQFSLAKIGIPATYFYTPSKFIGQPDDWGKQQVEAYEAVSYHQPSDEYNGSWNLDGQVDDARLAFWVGLRIADDDELPAWAPGDEFEAARKAAIDSLN
jgi:Zn-dependent M28 family amino/carboxypeptidase